MREFKFIRGIYKNENILNQDETKDTLFALYKNGSPVSLEVKNDKEFQKTIVDLDSDKREIYTIRPSQFKVTATKQNTGNYELTYDLDGNVYDNSMGFPDKVKEEAESHLKSEIEADIPKEPSLILKDYTPKTTPVEFTYDDKSFTKNLYFSVTGDVEEHTIEIAEGKDITAYKMNDSGVNFNDKRDHSTFHNGKLQEEIPTENRSIAPMYMYNVSESNYLELDVASEYFSKEGFMFVCDNGLTDNVSYNDIIDSYLYKHIKDTVYLTPASESEALGAGNVVNDNFVAYKNSDCPNACYKIESVEGPAYEFSDDDCVAEGFAISGMHNEYTFYKKNRGPAYFLIGKCTTKSRETTIVKGYAMSLLGLFIIKNNNNLEQLTDDDLVGKKNIDVYTEKNDSYKVIFGGVYTDKDNDNYVTLSNKQTNPITKHNAYINESGDIAPQQDSNKFRQIIKETLKIEATESYSY